MKEAGAAFGGAEAPAPPGVPLCCCTWWYRAFFPLPVLVGARLGPGPGAGAAAGVDEGAGAGVKVGTAEAGLGATGCRDEGFLSGTV